MGFMKRFFSLGKRTKKRRPELEVDELDPPVSVEYLDAEATMTRLLRSSSARQSMGGTVYPILEPGHLLGAELHQPGDPSDVPARRRSASVANPTAHQVLDFNWLDPYEAQFAMPARTSTSPLQRTYTVTIHSRTRTEIPIPSPSSSGASKDDTKDNDVANTSHASTSTNTHSSIGEGRKARPRSRSLPLNVLALRTPRRERESRLLHLAEDPSVANLLMSNIYDSGGRVKSLAFANTSNTSEHGRHNGSLASAEPDEINEEGRLQTRRTGSTLKELLGVTESQPRTGHESRYSTQEGDLSWAERVIGEELDFDDQGTDACDIPADLQSRIADNAECSDKTDVSCNAPPNVSDTMSSLGIERSTKLFARDDSDNFFLPVAADCDGDALSSLMHEPAPAELAYDMEPQKAHSEDSCAYGGVSISSISVETGDIKETNVPELPHSDAPMASSAQQRSPIQQAPTQEPSTPPAAEVFAFLTQRRRSKTVTVLSPSPSTQHRNVADMPSEHAPLVAVPTGGSTSSANSDTYRPSNRTSIDGTRPVVHHLRPSLVGALPPPPSYPEPRVKRKRSRSTSAVDDRTHTRKVTVTRASKVTMSPAHMQYVEVPAGTGTLFTPREATDGGSPLPSRPLSPSSTRSRSRIPRKSAANSPPVPPLPTEITLVHPTPESSAQLEMPDRSLWKRDAFLDTNLFLDTSSSNLPLPEDPFTQKPVKHSHKRAASTATGYSPAAKRRAGKTKERRIGGKASEPPESKSGKIKRQASGDKENDGSSAFVVPPTGVPMTPVRQKVKVLAHGIEPPSPASSTELSPIAKTMMANVREQRMRMRAREHEREKARGRRFASRTGSRG
ncbi:hypothetical protein PUNSTDRAFT_143091 [Punctularia strigosozonata HHB-11173 SS5]|uniref:uncharacterized protein n=1 Tax=Punctularia strigosozonata (strain HHB-11173) TaxID=741275 RepID=UPI0004416C78|nr:uncharacterized protein PUNSTDRAFT_143091 [Punctularia strigosozonata HHB-11173 SS5]EIN09569.1 hypothetical protein PUNSTDRAFT_143091 [Punctularia strigosozonata HHB-11173 SS5]